MVADCLVNSCPEFLQSKICTCYTYNILGLKQIVIFVFEYSVMTTNEYSNSLYWLYIRMYVSGIIMKISSCYDPYNNIKCLNNVYDQAL